VLNAGGTVVRHMSRVAVPPVKEAAQPPEPNFWIATPQPLPIVVGTNRVNWDLRMDDPPAFTRTFEINANPGSRRRRPRGRSCRLGSTPSG